MTNSKRIEVAFCGNSVYLSGLANVLRQDARLRVTQIDVPPAKAMKDLELLRPDVVVAEDVDSRTAFVLRKQKSVALVIAIQAATNSLTILDDRQLLNSSVQNLARVITEHAAGQYKDREISANNKEEKRC